MKLTSQLEDIIERASIAYVNVKHTNGSHQRSAALEAHRYAMRRILTNPEKYGLQPSPSNDTNSNEFGYKAFKIHFGGEWYWICARTDIEALQTMVTDVGIEFSDFDHDDSIEVIPSEQWPQFNIVDPETDLEEHDELEVLETLAQHMAAAKAPGFIASTDY